MDGTIFSQVPLSLLTPGQYVEIDNSRALKGLPLQRQKILVLGQRTAAATVAANTPVLISNPDQANGFFGRGSMLAAMVIAAKKANSYTEMWAMGVSDNGAGVAATGTITIGGAPTAAGTLSLMIAGTSVQVAVASGESNNTTAASLAAAVNALLDLPVTAAAVNAVVTLTARHKGDLGNAIDVRANYYQGEALPAGLTCAIVAMANGATDPSLTAAIAAMGDEQYHTVVFPWTSAAALTAIETELVRRFNAMVAKEGHAFSAAVGSVSTLDTLGDGRNCPHLTIMDAGNLPTPPWVVAAVTGAIDAYEPDPARPRQTLALPGILPAALASRRTRDERNLLLSHGIATHIVDAGGTVLIERLATTYKTNGFGAPDASYLDVETLRTVAYLRFSLRTRVALRYPRMKLAGDDHPGGLTVVRPKDLRAEFIALFNEWQDAGLAENLADFQANLVVQRDPNDPNRVNAVIPPDIINQFRVFAGLLQFRL
jgi:phage tail sheath gpL-like